jgi:hypothetical protein
LLWQKLVKLANQEMAQNQKTISELRNRLERELLKLPNTFLNGDSENRIYNTTNICFKGQDANVLIGRMKNIAVSNGSACSSAVVEPSHVLKAMGLSDDDAFASLRFSLGKYNTENDIEIVVKKIKSLFNQVLIMLRDCDWSLDRDYKTGSENEPLQFYLDGLANSNEFNLLLGYFSSSAINLLSVGFATFISKGGKMRMVINHLLSAKDKELFCE